MSQTRQGFWKSQGYELFPPARFLFEDATSRTWGERIKNAFSTLSFVWMNDMLFQDISIWEQKPNVETFQFGQGRQRTGKGSLK